MNASRLLEYYDRVADAPDAVTRLRHLILDLAVRGKLVPQSEGGEPTSEFLKRITAETSRRSVSRTRKTADHNQPKGTNPFTIPSTWEWVSLGSITRIQTGKLDANAAVLGGLYPFFTCSQTPSTIDRFSFDTAAILLAGNGDFNLKRYHGKFDAYQRTYVIEPIDWDLDFCYTILQSQIARITEHQRGSAIPYLKINDITELMIPMPPFSEQHRIVSRIDELMVLCDNIEAKRLERESTRDRFMSAILSRLNEPAGDSVVFADDARFVIRSLDVLTTRPGQLKQLREAILNLAVRGKLVPQELKDEPALALLNRIAVEKEQLVRSGALRSRETLSPVTGDDIPFEVPRSWVWTRLGTICFLITDGAHHTPKYENEGVPFLSVKDVSSGSIDFSKARFISQEAHDELCKRCKPERGDLLLTKVGTTGIAVEIDVDRPFSIFVSLALLKISRVNLSRRYLRLLINSPYVKKQSAANTQGIGNKNLVLRLINQFTIPLPPLAEQHRIVSKVEEMLALCTELETSLNLGVDATTRLLDALISEALQPPVMKTNGRAK
jgi:type I restriction enzyme S subunit